MYYNFLNILILRRYKWLWFCPHWGLDGLLRIPRDAENFGQSINIWWIDRSTLQVLHIGFGFLLIKWEWVKWLWPILTRVVTTSSLFEISGGIYHFLTLYVVLRFWVCLIKVRYSNFSAKYPFFFFYVVYSIRWYDFIGFCRWLKYCCFIGLGIRFFISIVQVS